MRSPWLGFRPGFRARRFPLTFGALPLVTPATSAILNIAKYIFKAL